MVASVSRIVRTSDSLETYTGFSGVNFTLVVGEGYSITVTNSVTYVPSHY